MTSFLGSSGGASDIFGSRVSPTPLVTGPTLNAAFPNLSGVNAAASGALTSELTGQLSPQTMNNIQNAAAQFGITSGMPGSQFAFSKYPTDIGLATEALQHQGIGDYSSLIPSVASTQTVNPNTMASLNAEIDSMNRINAAAPNPAAAGSYAQELFDKYLKQLQGPAGGTGTTPWYEQGEAGRFYTPPLTGEMMGGSVFHGGQLLGAI